MAPFGSRIIVPRAPIADIINPSVVDCSLADIYSMFRLVRGYTGYCRRVMRTADLSERSFGFTAGGLYDLKGEQTWAAGSDVAVLGWYNQSPAARTSSIDTGTLTDPRSINSGSPATLGGYAAIEMLPGSSLVQDTRIPPIDYADYVSTVWIGSALYEEEIAFSEAWSVHTESTGVANSDYNFKFNATDTSLARTRGIYYGRVGTFTHPASNFSNRSMIAMTHQVASPYGESAWVNGSARAITSAGSVSSVDVGGAMVFGPNIVHTYIVDGSSSRAIRDLAVASFNARNWIY